MGEGVNCPETIRSVDVRSEALAVGGTEIIVQRHGEYIRSADDAMVGHLKSRAALEAEKLAENVFGGIVKQIPKGEQGRVEILVAASDTKKGTGQRCIETAQRAIDGIKTVLIENNLQINQLLNTQEGRFRGGEGPRPTAGIREPRIFSDSQEFVKFLEEKYGTGQPFWKAFEEDTEADVRKAMGAEGPWELAERLDRFIKALAEYSRLYHKENPGKRLVVWVVTHYDTISPYVKRYLANVGKDKYIPVDYGAGFSINIRPDGVATSKIGETTYPVPTRKDAPLKAT